MTAGAIAALLAGLVWAGLALSRFPERRRDLPYDPFFSQLWLHRLPLPVRRAVLLVPAIGLGALGVAVLLGA